MKKVILGSTMFLTGVISVALLLAGSMANEWTVDGQFSSAALWNISHYGLMPVLYSFIEIAVAGLALAIWGLFNKKD